MSARVMQIIVTELERRGDGVKDSPLRIVRQFWSLDGNLLAEVDPLTDRFAHPFIPTQRDGGTGA